jgi:hypothetical protein
MDGVQELVGVTVLAATNRPEAIVSGFVIILLIYFDLPIFRILHLCVQAGWIVFFTSAHPIRREGRRFSKLE